MSPPARIPCSVSRNAIVAAPEVWLPCAIGVPASRQLSPRSVVRSTLARAAAPVAIQPCRSPRAAVQVPLAAKAPSPVWAGGRRSPKSRQVRPSAVRTTGKRPFTASLMVKPLRSFQKAKQS